MWFQWHFFWLTSHPNSVVYIGINMSDLSYFTSLVSSLHELGDLIFVPVSKSSFQRLLGLPIALRPVRSNSMLSSFTCLHSFCLGLHGVSSFPGCSAREDKFIVFLKSLKFASHFALLTLDPRYIWPELNGLRLLKYISGWWTSFSFLLALRIIQFIAYDGRQNPLVASSYSSPCMFIIFWLA